jgi:hypothetical protein
MDGFSGYNQIQIHPADQYKTAFITPWGTFAYRVMPFGLKNAGATFQRAMTYIFHDLAEIILAYLDDLTARSKKRTQHLNDLRIIFQRCRQYNIHLNPLKCVFCVTVRAPPRFYCFPKWYYRGPPQSQSYHRNSTSSEFTTTSESTGQS